MKKSSFEMCFAESEVCYQLLITVDMKCLQPR